MKSTVMSQLTPPSQPITIQMDFTQGHTPAHVPVFVNDSPKHASPESSPSQT